MPILIHDDYGRGRHAKIFSTKAKDRMKDGEEYTTEPPLTGDECRVTEVDDVEWPERLDLVDDVPPATIITAVVESAGMRGLPGRRRS